MGGKAGIRTPQAPASLQESPPRSPCYERPNGTARSPRQRQRLEAPSEKDNAPESYTPAEPNRLWIRGRLADLPETRRGHPHHRPGRPRLSFGPLPADTRGPHTMKHTTRPDSLTGVPFVDLRPAL